MRTIRRTMLLISLSIGVYGGCAFDPSGGPGGGPGPGPSPGEDVDAAVTPTGPTADVVCRVEGARLGVVGLRVQAGPTIVTFTAWQRDPQHPADYVGFTLDAAAAGLRYEVTTDHDQYVSEGLTWNIPTGRADRPGTESITRVDFCAGG